MLPSENTLEHTPPEIWEFMRKHGVRKVLLGENDFELLLEKGQWLNAMQLVSRLKRKLGPLPKPSKLLGFEPRSKTRWETRASEPKPRFGFTKEEKEQADDINNDARILESYRRGIQQLFNLVKFGIENIPNDLAVDKAKVDSSSQYPHHTRKEDTTTGKPEKGPPEQEYAPNRKYQKHHFKAFAKLWKEKQSQELAYDELVAQFPGELQPDKCDSFLGQFRLWKKNQGKPPKDRR